MKIPQKPSWLMWDHNIMLGSFDFISCLSALHHMPLQPALERLSSLLAPGGTLAVLGHYKVASPFDYLYVGLTGLVDLAVGAVRHRTQAPLRRPQGVVQDWHDSLREIKTTTSRLLPGSIVKRHMYDRYSLIYSRPV